MANPTVPSPPLTFRRNFDTFARFHEKHQSATDHPVNDPGSLAPAAESRNTGCARLLAEGLAARQRGNLTFALSRLRAALAQNPTDIEIAAEIALTLQRLRQWDEAQVAYKRILEQTPSHVPALIGLGQIARTRSDFKQAEICFQSAIALKANNSLARMELAGCFRKASKFDLAAQQYEAILTCYPKHPGALLGLARVARQTLPPTITLARYEAALAVDPENIQAKSELASALLSAGEPERALLLVARLLAHAPDSNPLQMTAGYAARQLGRTAEALEHFRSAAATDPQNPSIACEIAATLMRDGRIDEAEIEYRDALRLAPNHVNALRGLANVARSREQWLAALEHLQAARRLRSNDPQIQVELALTLRALQRREEAETNALEAFSIARAQNDAKALVPCFDYFCKSLMMSNAAECLAVWESMGNIPQSAIAQVSSYYAFTFQWDKIIRVIGDYLIRYGLPTHSVENLAESISRAARNLGAYKEALALVDQLTPAAGWDRIVELRDQLLEEAYARCPRKPSSAVPEYRSGSSGLRTQRSAILAKAFGATEGNPICTVYYCTDDAYLLGAATSLFSLLRHNLASLHELSIRVYCSQGSMVLASDVFRCISRAFGLHIDVRSADALSRRNAQLMTSWGTFGPSYGLSEAAYYRIYAALQILGEQASGRALYIDSDTHVGTGITAIVNHDLGGNPLGARTELASLQGIREAARKLDLPVENYFNSGVLLFDLAHPQLQSALQHSIEFAVNQQHLLTFLDQCALNVAFRGQVTGLPAPFNFFMRATDTDVDLSQAVITHYLARPKPWDTMYPNGRCLIWLEEFAAMSQLTGPALAQRLYLSQFGTLRDA